MSAHVLLQNATILVPSGKPDDSVMPLRNHSLLVRDDRICQIAENIIPPTDTEVIDCTDKIISPGLVDTHHHLWQTQLKGRHADQTLLEYLPNGNMQSANFTPEDIFWGELAGCLEALDAGTTTVVDHAHMNISSAHTSNGIEATVASGIRSVFCYAPTTRAESWKPDLTVSGSLLDDWVVKNFDLLGSMFPFGEGRVQLGLAFDGLMLPKEQVVSLSQSTQAPGQSDHIALCNNSLVDTLDEYGILGPDILLSHASNLLQSDIEKLSKAKAWISTTPDTELQMGHGDIVCFRDGCRDISALGIDCHSNNSSDMVSQMRLALQHERSNRTEKVLADGKSVRSLNLYVQDVFRLGTIQGARAIHMEDQLGSIEVGKRADLVIFDGTSPAMICASEQDPVAAIVLHSSIRDIDTVIVDGRILKRGGRLVPVDIKPSLPDVAIPHRQMEWSEVAKEVISSRRRIEDAITKAHANEPERLVDSFLKVAHMDPDRFMRL